IEGFESPYGMELLASVHWLVTRDGVPNDLDSIVQAMHRWNDRKQRIMKPEHIQVAWNRLQDLGWLGEDTGAMSIRSQPGAVQNPFVRYAVEAGWTYLDPEEALNLRRGLTSPVLDSVLVDQLRRLNPGTVDLNRAEQVRDRLIRVRPNIEGNLDAWEFVRGLK